MPNLRQGEYMHVCESDICAFTTGGSRAGKPRPYIVRNYYNEIEKHYCSTCLTIKADTGRNGIRRQYDDNGRFDGFTQIKE